VSRHWTTRCCSAFALIGVSTIIVIAAEPKHDPPLGLFPAIPAWDLPLNNTLQATPAFKDARGYFPIEGDRVACYDVLHGTLLWVSPASTQSQPALGDRLVFVAEADAVLALHDDTGVTAWRFPLKERLSTPLAWSNGWLIATAASGTVLAFRARDGSLIWQQELGAPIHASAALAADRVYLPMTDGRIVALRIETGEPLWERRLGGSPNEILALDWTLYVGSNDNYFYAIAARDGQILWRWGTGADVIGRPVVDDRRVYFVSFDNVLRALDRKTGNQRWKRPLPLRPTRGPVVMGDALFVSGTSGTAPAYFLKDGNPAGSLAASGELAASPHVVAGERLPMLLLVARDIARGTIVRALTRAIEPQPTPVSPLPNAITPPIPNEPPAP
jgi:outer membrane protein assembly factor BamB